MQSTIRKAKPCLQRCYTTLPRDAKPNNSIKNAKGITEVYIMKGKKSRGPKLKLSQRLRSCIDSVGWEEIDASKIYKRVEPANDVPVPQLAHGLEKVLFNPGVHYLKDPRTKHFNFTPFLQEITQPSDFDYDALQPYITSSKDTSLVDMAKDRSKRYVGSTSSVSAVLSHLYFVMSGFMPVNISCLSQVFTGGSTKFTRGARAPASIYLRWKDGVYAVDVDKSHNDEETILSIMGKSLEKVLTSEPSSFERYLKENSHQITEEERNQPESYAYGELGNLLLRSQIDCYDPRLPRNTFDLKTRATMPVRLDIQNYTDYLGYSLKRSHGLYESFEREYYDMIRSAFLKYTFQVRIGHMDGILVAYHNTKNMFGFQYISREEMDVRLFGSTRIGDQVFRNALVMFESILDTATAKYPQQTLRISFDTRQTKDLSETSTFVYVEAVPSEDDDTCAKTAEEPDEFFQTSPVKTAYDPYDEITMYQLKTQSHINGNLIKGSLSFKNPLSDHWKLSMRLEEVQGNEEERFKAMRRKQALVFAPNSIKKNPLLSMLKRISENSKAT